jgi:hypothetical protein
MKKLFTLTLIITSLFSCTVDKELLTKEDLSKWSSKNDTISYNGKPVAIYDHFEYELNPSHGRGAKPIVELSIVQISFEAETAGLIRYVHTFHSKQKVEIVVPKHRPTK